jgi:hypothetical protein
VIVDRSMDIRLASSSIADAGETEVGELMADDYEGALTRSTVDGIR